MNEHYERLTKREKELVEKAFIAGVDFKTRCPDVSSDFFVIRPIAQDCIYLLDGGA